MSNSQDHLQARKREQIKSFYESDPALPYKTHTKNKKLFSLSGKKTLNTQLQQAPKLSH